MKKILLALLALLTFGWAVPAQAEARWQRFNVDRAYNTRAQAMSDARNVMVRAGWDAQCIPQMLDTLEKPGTRVMISKGERYDFMRTGPQGLWRNVRVDFQQAPLRVEGERWSIECNGRVYTLTLPDVCNNWLGTVVGIDCVYITVEKRHASEQALNWQRTQRPDDVCWGYRFVDRLYQTDSPTAVWTKPPTGCLGPCTFEDFNRAYGHTTKSNGSIELGEDVRFVQFRLARDEIPAFCLKVINGQQVWSSFTNGVRWQQDYQLIGSEWHARVFYDSSELKQAGHSFNNPGGLALWAANERDEAIMRGFR